MLDGLLEAFHDAYLEVMVDDATLQVLAERQYAESVVPRMTARVFQGCQGDLGVHG